MPDAASVVISSEVPSTFELSIRRGGAANVKIQCEEDEIIVDLRCRLADKVGGVHSEYKLCVGPYTLLDDMKAHVCIGEEVWFKRVKPEKTDRSPQLCECHGLALCPEVDLAA